MEIDYLREELTKLKQENIELKQRIDKRKRTTGKKVYSVIIKSEKNERIS
jgi:cell shape-determining protein MreC